MNHPLYPKSPNLTHSLRSTMSFASLLLPEITSCSHSCDGCRLHLVPSSFAAGLHCTDGSGRRWSRSRLSMTGREWEWEWEGWRRRWWRVSANALRVVEGSGGGGGVSVNPTIDIPVTCYQIIGVPDNAEKDQIVKSVLNLRNAEIEEGYTTEAVTSRQDLLMDVRDKLLFEPEFAGNVKENISPKSSLRIPWAWLTGALYLLQEVGEQKLVLDIGQAALKYPNSRPYAHDLLLSMALAECAVAKINFEKNHISQGFEALAQAQRLLKREASLGKIKLLFQIEASLEELTPACTLEILCLPPLPDNSERRQGAIAALRELLIQSLDVVSASNIHDWPSFLSQALATLTAGEIVELLPWDQLSITRKNKKSIECQNQRVVIDFSCFYTVLVAHIALGFSSRKKDLIAKAKALCESLMASEGIDLKFEEALCLLLLGQGDEAEIEKLHRLKKSIKHASQNSVLAKQNEVSLPNPSLEIWLKDVVLGLFSDTRDCSPSLDKYFNHDNKANDSKLNRGAPQILPGLGQRRLYHALSSDRRIDNDLGPVVKQPARLNLQNAPQETRAENQSDMTSAQFKRELGSRRNQDVESSSIPKFLVEGTTFVAVLGCIVFVTCRLMGMHCRKLPPALWLGRACQMENSSFSTYKRDSISDDYPADRIKNLISLAFSSLRNSPSGRSQKGLCLTASLSSTLPAVCSRVMPVEEAEALVRQWQAIKAEALGPNHQVHLLTDVLDDSMLHQWEGLADAAYDKSCFWKFVLLQLSVLRAEILSDSLGPERAEIEVLLEEAAELVGESQEKNPNYCSTYKISYALRKQNDGSWKFIKADVEAPP